MRQACNRIVEDKEDFQRVLKALELKQGSLYKWLRDGTWKRPDWQVAMGNKPHLPPESEQMLAKFFTGMALAGFPIKVKLALSYGRRILINK